MLWNIFNSSLVKVLILCIIAESRKRKIFSNMYVSHKVRTLQVFAWCYHYIVLFWSEEQYYDHIMQKMGKEINKQSDVNFWLDWRKYGTVSYSFSCSCSVHIVYIDCSEFFVEPLVYFVFLFFNEAVITKTQDLVVPIVKKKVVNYIKLCQVNI